MAFTYRDYVEGQKVQQAQQTVQQHQEQNKPADYVNQYKPQMDALYDQYANRKFRYDVNTDAMYKQAQQRAIQQGQQAMMDTMGQAAQLTGGYGNSYAQSVGQQTYQGYLQSLADQIPQYYQMAMEQYNAEGDKLLNQYGMLGDQEKTDYNRYTDMVNRYYSELDRLQGIYERERAFDYGRYSDDRGLAYTDYRNDISDQQWQRQFDENVRQFNESQALQREIAAMNAAARAASSSSGSTRKVKAQTYDEIVENPKAAVSGAAAGALANMAWLYR